MARPLRIEFPGALWHITSRGNEKRRIYVTERDFKEFIELLVLTVELFRWRLYEYCLIPNHYHLLFETPEKTLSKGIHKLNGDYASKFNRRHARVGHLFQGRFHSRLVEKESHLLEVARYIALNPVRAALCRDPADWPWSSYRAIAGIEEPPAWLDTDWTLRAFDPIDRTTAQQRYREFVTAGIGIQDPKRCESEPFLASREFRKTLLQKLPDHRNNPEYPKEYRQPYRPTFTEVVTAISSAYGQTREQLRHGRGTEARMTLAYAARRESGVAINEIGAFLRITSAGVAWLIRLAKKRLLTDERFRERLNEVLSRAKYE